MDAIYQVIDHAERCCKENGTRLTEKRRLALSLLSKSDKTLSAYELLEVYKVEKGDALPVMSMYRILKYLMVEHLIHHLELVNKYVACVHINCEVEHAQTQFLTCAQCQKMKEIRTSELIVDAIKKNIGDAGFRLAGPQLEMNCICDDCMSSAG